MGQTIYRRAMLDSTRCLDPPTHSAPRRLLGLLAMLGLIPLVFGCGGSGASTSGGSSEATTAHLQSKSVMSAHDEQPEQAPREAGFGREDSGRTGASAASRPTPRLRSREPRSIPGMNADAVAAIFLKPGLECSQPVVRGMLYACTGEENPNLTLLYEGEIAGRGAGRVSGVDARVFRRGPGDFEVASLPFLGLLATQLKYSGADREKAYGFLNSNLDSKRAAITIGAAEWTITTSRDRKVLAVAAD